jgi:CRP-like cAMP-binding protein
MFLVKNMPKFRKFMRFNGLDEEHLTQAANYMEHVFIPKGSYIFKQGDPSNKFYCVISGSVSVRIKKPGATFNIDDYLPKSEAKNPQLDTNLVLKIRNSILNVVKQNLNENLEANSKKSSIFRSTSLASLNGEDIIQNISPENKESNFESLKSNLVSPRIDNQIDVLNTEQTLLNIQTENPLKNLSRQGTLLSSLPLKEDGDGNTFNKSPSGLKSMRKLKTIRSVKSFVSRSQYMSKLKKNIGNLVKNGDSNSPLQNIPTDIQKIANQIEYDMEKEVMILTNGMAFGEWAMIYNIERTASAYTIEDTHLFYLSKEYFELVFSRGILRADNEKKNFILKRIPSLKFAGAGNILDILKNIIPVFCDNKKIVFTEFDSGEFIYIVYQGECRLTKLYLDRKPNSLEEIYKKQEKLITIANIVKGGLVGLEIIKGNKNYEYTFVCSKDETILYKISMKFLRECNRDIFDYFKPLLDSQESHFKSFKEKYEKISHNFKLTEKPKISNSLTNSENIFENKRLEEIHDQKVLKLIEKSRRTNDDIKNNFPTFSINIGENLTYNNFFSRQKENAEKKAFPKTKLFNSNLKYKISTSDEEKIYTSTLCTPFITQNHNTIVANNLNNLPSKSKNLFEHNKCKSIISDHISIKERDANSNYQTISHDSFSTKKHKFTINTKYDSNLNFYSTNTNSNPVSKDMKVQTNFPRESTIPSLVSKPINLKRNIRTNSVFEKDKIDMYRPTIFIAFNKSMTKSRDESSNKVYIKKSIENTLTKFKLDKKDENIFRYDSGIFNLPMVSLNANKKARSTNRSQDSYY